MKMTWLWGTCALYVAGYVAAVGVAMWAGWPASVVAVTGGAGGLLGLGLGLTWFVARLLRQTAGREQQVEQQLQQLHEARQQFDQLLAQRETELALLRERLEAETIQRRQAEQQAKNQQNELLDVSRKAGMADMATSVLHNVGNVLNSINVTASLVREKLEHSRLASLGKAVNLIKDHADELPRFLGEDPQGKQLPLFLDKLAEALAGERDGLIQESNNLIGHINHVKEVIAVQQSVARVVGAIEPFDLAEAIEDALKINMAGLQRHHVTVQRSFQKGLIVKSDRHKIIQILINLISNAKYAIHDAGKAPGEMTIAVQRLEGDRVAVSVRDDGVGIAPQDQPKLFRRGFTTRATGHGFGLHASALAAQELHGIINVHSDGPGCGATFTLQFPVDSPGKTPCPSHAK
ncbi:MAG: hypothetical protein IT445_20315 [Phycisphaeraceae bacterium]|nr:hypothetical protein [Phycisphaeraceae bacterium]